MSAAATTPGIRLGRNAGLNLAGQILPLAVALAAMPIVVRGLGPARFGLLALSWTIVGYLGVLDLGFGRAATKRVSEMVWTDRADRVRTLGATVLVVQAVLGLLTGGLLVRYAGAIAGLLVPDAALEREGAVILALLGLAVPAVLAGNALRAVLEGLHRFDLVNYARAPLSAAIYVVSAAGVLVGAGLPVIVAGLVLTRWAGVVVWALLYRHAAPAGPTSFDSGLLRDLFRFGGWVALSNTLVPIGAYLERFVLSGLRGPAALAYYSAPQELLFKLHVLPAAITGVLFPAFSGLSARGERTELQRQVRRGIRLVALLLVVPAAALIVAAEPLLTVWLGADYGRLSAGVLRVLAAALFLNGIAFVPFVLAEGVGRPELVARYHLVELPAYVAVVWILTARFGIMGTAAAWAARMIVMAPGLYLLVLPRAGLDTVATFRGSAGAAVAGSLLLLAVALLLPTLAGPRAALLPGLLVIVAFTLLAWRRVLEDGDRRAVRTLRDRLLRRRPAGEATDA